MSSRRAFLVRSSHLAAAGSLAGLSPSTAAGPSSDPFRCEDVSLDGRWQFHLDPTGGESPPAEGWADVLVPHTWQISPESAAYMGVAWYRRRFEARPDWAGGAVRVEFEAVFHSAVVWVNGREAGRHIGKGYTAFSFDITALLRFDQPNEITVRVNNAFDEAMLPRGRSSDWTHDGGIYRPVRLLVTPKVWIERVEVDAVPDLGAHTARIEVAAILRNGGTGPWRGAVHYRVVEEESGLTVLAPPPASASLKARETLRVATPAAGLREPKLWHFDHPHLYRLEVEIEGHRYSTTFGIRSIEVRGEGFYLNGERVWLMGVERMAGSHPEYGMAEPMSWLQHDHDDLKELNCVFTRVHWPQDRRVLDYCDRHGILIQTEIPTWGGQTFAGMRDEPSHAILENGLEQLREMIQRDRNHPCIFSWGLCNEINGQNPPAYQFARRMAEEARKLDPGRLRSYASNSLQKTPERDVAGLMDFIEWNEYYETWYRGTPEDMRRNLEQIQRAFPGKPIVISEYGYCACTAERKEGDQRRIEILREHDRIFRENSAVAGLIFFCYNDYRTHVGDKGSGVLKQRVHGVVDLYGGRKPSFEVLRRESSPIAALEVKRHPGSYAVTVQARSGVPAYPVEGYFVRAVLYGAGQIPLEQAQAKLPRLAPGESAEVLLPLQEPHPVLVRFDIVRPTGFSALSEIWKP